MTDKTEQSRRLQTSMERQLRASALAARLTLSFLILSALLLSTFTLMGCTTISFLEGFSHGYSEGTITKEMISHVEEKFGKIDYEVVSFTPSGPFNAYAKLHAHVRGIKGDAGDFWVKRYVVDGVSVVRDDHEVGDVVFEDSYYRVVVFKEFQKYAQSVASEVFPKCKVSVDIRGDFADDVLADTPMAEAFNRSEGARGSVFVIVEGDYASSEEFLDAGKLLLDKWLEDGVVPYAGIRCFLMKPGEYDRVDMSDVMSVRDKETFVYDVGIFTRGEVIKILD
jgi:hypothetical protein